MTFTDYYKALGIAADASAADIKAAYRKLARTCHPDIDRWPGAEKRFTAIGAAHDVLGDQYLDLHIATPPTCSDKAKGHYRELAAEGTFAPRQGLGV